MKYYLIDENKVRTYLESSVVYNNSSINTVNKKFVITLNNVNYEIDGSDLKVDAVEPQNENAFALTTEGLVSWKKQSVIIEKSKKSELYKGVWTNVFEHREIINYRFAGNFEMFCSGYVCLGKRPSENTIKITVKNLGSYNYLWSKYYTIEQADFNISETENSLVIEKSASKSDEFYYIGPVINGTLYPIIQFGLPYYYLKAIITRGTCFKVKYVIRNVMSNKPDSESVQTPYELCY